MATNIGKAVNPMRPRIRTNLGAEDLERAYDLAEQIERVLASGEAGQEPTWSSVALGHPGGEIVAAVVAILRKMGRDAELGGDGIDSIKVRL